jgi:hypothetical protein
LDEPTLPAQFNGQNLAYLLLACSERRELFNHDASQSNYGACLSAGGDKEEFLYSAFADVNMLQFNSS